MPLIEMICNQYHQLVFTSILPLAYSSQSYFTKMERNNDSKLKPAKIQKQVLKPLNLASCGASGTINNLESHWIKQPKLNPVNTIQYTFPPNYWPKIRTVCVGYTEQFPPQQKYINDTPIRKRYSFSTIFEIETAPTSRIPLINDEIILNENLSNINPQKKRPRPLKIAPQLPITVRKESFVSFIIPYYLQLKAINIPKGIEEVSVSTNHRIFPELIIVYFQSHEIQAIQCPFLSYFGLMAEQPMRH